MEAPGFTKHGFRDSCFVNCLLQLSAPRSLNRKPQNLSLYSGDMSQPYTPICNEIHRDGGQARFNVSTKSWVTQVKGTLDAPDKMWHVSKNVCIYRVPKSIRISKPEAYAPMVVSLGPYHHNNNPELSSMHQHKLEAVRRMLSRLKIDMTTLTAEIEKLEHEVRECYQEPLKLDKEELSLMLALDACFILEFLRGEISSECFSLVFPPVSNTMTGAISNDTLKMENQIPLSILIKILELECRAYEHATTKLAEMLSNNILFRGFPFPISSDEKYKSQLKKYIENKPPPRHLLDLYRIVIEDILRNSSSSESDTVHEPDHHAFQKPPDISSDHCLDILPCLSPTLSEDDSHSNPKAELLHKAGIKFKSGPLRFEKRNFGISTLFLPQITIVDITDILLRNLMAYEECHNWSWSPKVTVISNFIKLLDDLIDSEKDVSILRKSLVIQSCIGSDEDIACMFNHLCDGITVTSIQIFEVVMKEARDHYKSQWKVWMSQFKQEHCSKPWKVLSIAAAILILVMTAVQTVYSVKK